MEFGTNSHLNNSLNKSKGGGVGTPQRKKPGIQRSRRGIDGEQGEERAYDSALQLYGSPPTMDITLEMFEDFAVERLRVLRTLEKHNMGGKTKFSKPWIDDIWKDLEKHGLIHYLKLGDRQHGSEKVNEEMYLAHRRMDHISHFILRLAYCRTEEFRRWFVNHETDLFRLRWLVLTENEENRSNITDHIGEFMEYNYDFTDPANPIPLSTKYQPISSELKDELEKDLQACTGGSMLESFYRVPWQEAVDLVRTRRVLVRAGWAYIPQAELLSLVVGMFRSRVSRDLVHTNRVLPMLEEDQRLVGMINNLDKRYTGEDYGNNKSKDKVMPAQIPELAKQNFPLCMKSMQEVLATTHHIKYKSRLQYGLFLKGIGLTLEDALKFFRGEFTKKADTDIDKFEKEYAYGIRYNYGKEGKKKNWQPYDCMRIIMESVGPGETHGCPFRHHEGRTIRQRVEAYGGLKKEQVDAILAKVEEGHYQIACGMHYSAVHLKDLSTGAVSHPNQWYLESRGLVSAGGEGKGGNKNAFKHLNTTKASIYASQVSQASQSVQDSQMVEMDDSELMEIMDTGTPISTQDLLQQYGGIGGGEAEKENKE